jgi:Protein of unknown function (DUF4230)
MIKKYMTYAIIIISALIGISIYKLLFTNNATGSSMFNFLFLAIGLIGGAALFYILGNRKWFGKADHQKIEASVMLNKIERVFKVVTAEGHFSEVFDYSQTTHIASFIPSTKKALLIVNAKVLMGYDFKKCVFDIDEESRKIKVVSFPAPEILSVEQDIKYYNMENGLFNKFDNEDLTKLQAEAKQKIVASVAKSELPSIAQKQVQQLLAELNNINQWQLQGEEKILLPAAQ